MTVEIVVVDGQRYEIEYSRNDWRAAEELEAVTDGSLAAGG